MNRTTISSDGRYLERDGRPLFVVADTAWSAFADATTEEWREYTARRAAQGFTHILVSALPILHDRALRSDAREPFALNAEGNHRYDEPNPDYFENMVSFAEIAAANGIGLGLVVLWFNYVPDTRRSERFPAEIMPAGDREAYVDDLVDRMARFDPLFIISGDDRFTGHEAGQVFHEVLKQVKSRAPQCLVTMHSTPFAVLPDDIVNDEALDFFSYQSGHDMEQRERQAELSEQYLAYPKRRPIMNLEPAYEGHGYGGGRGRFRSHDIRRDVWLSLATGASAGIGYGAHGLWQWYRDGTVFTNQAWALEPFSWRTALGFAGAEDVCFAARIMVDEGLVGADPQQGLLVDPYFGLRAFGHANGPLAFYLSDSRDFEVRVDLTGRDVVGWELATRVPITPRLRATKHGTLIRRPDALSDVVIVAR